LKRNPNSQDILEKISKININNSGGENEQKKNDFLERRLDC